MKKAKPVVPPKVWKILRSRSIPFFMDGMSSLRHCHNCGGKLETRFVKAEGKDRRVCPKCGRINYLNPKVVGAVLPVKNGKIYLARRNLEPAFGAWTFPAGYQEWAETVEDCARRETWEEIRARVKIEKLAGIYSYPDSSVVTVVYLAKVVGKKPRPGPESICVGLFAPSEIPWDELAFRSTYEALRDWVKTLV